MTSGMITSASYLGLLSINSGPIHRTNSQQHQSLIKMHSFRDNKMLRISEGSFVSSRRIIHSAFASTRSEMGVHNAESKEEEEEEISRGDLLNTVMHWQKVQGFALAGVLAHFLLAIPLANATDALKIYGCLLKECRVELAKCMGNPSCAANIACVEMCSGRPDETECQMKCGDLFGNEVVNEFNQCALSRRKCVPKISAVGEFPVPDPSILAKSFNISDLSGKWYITSGINPMFDTFDCQVSEFHMESNKLVGNLTWRIWTPDGSFFTRSSVQKFVQDPYQPAILYNHNNEYLNYQDDWFILSSSVENKADDYVFVYYRGRNDAWDGYGGAVVYTRSSVLPSSIVPKLQRAAEGVGLDFSKFIRTDNTCGPELPLVQRLEKTAEEGKKTIIREAEEEVTVLQRQAEGLIGAIRDADNFLRGLSKEEIGLLDDLKMEATEVEKIFGRALPIRKLKIK